MQRFEKDHIAALRPHLSECMVLLKRNGAFPLDGPCRIAAFGYGVWNTVKGGSGSGEVNSRYFVDIGHGLEQAGFTITNRDWPEQFAPFLARAKEEFKRGIKRKAKEQHINPIAASMGAVLLQPEYEIDLDLTADAAIYVVARLSGEGNDRLPVKGDFELTDSEVRDIRALDRAYDRFMLIINAGGPVDLSPVAGVGNILVMSQLGVESGDAVADVILGRAYPSGKLTTTWSRYRDYCSLGDFAERDDTRYREGIFVGYRYFDAIRKEPTFPFGFGLGYTDFSIGSISADCVGPHVILGARIENTGCYNGKETLQVYVSYPQGKLVREAKSLAGFAKSSDLAPGEAEPLLVDFDIRSLAGYDAERAQYILEAGAYIILVGTSSANARPCAYFKLGKELVVKQVRNLFGSVDFKEAGFRADVEYSLDGLIEISPDVREIDLQASGKPSGTLSWRSLFKKGLDIGREPSEHADESQESGVLDGLANEELAYLNMGAFDPNGGLLSIIGNAAQGVAGAAGETTLQLREKGIRNLVMADGPAGLRLARQYYEDENGVHAIGMTIPESVMDILPGPIRWMLTRKPRLRKGTVVKEQYATALPIATAIAQSFNLDFAELCGDIVGSEMDAFNVDLWLAPALNIHRNVLCGRNFEYFSEDPFVSGKFAAALTRGVQRHQGRGVTIKHFAANNQETNRYANNSIVSERALREIYLRGFEICIREAHPLALMTSYNLLNGVHTSERADLTEVLRGEFGFDGIIMTDWIVGSDLLVGDMAYPPPSPGRVAAAGCSLFMPGTKKDYESLCKALDVGEVSREQLARNAEYLLRLIGKKR